MTTPPLPHRRGHAHPSAKSIRPRYPPQPPRWTTKAHSISALAPYIFIDIYSDTPNILTLAYTYTKPGEHQRNIIRLGVVRPHHFAYSATNLNYLNQIQDGPSLRHTFALQTVTGCWKVYYAAFNGHFPDTANSISPIFALEYCATSPAPPTAEQFNTLSPPPVLQPGDFLLITEKQPPTTSLASITASGADLTPILAPKLFSFDSFSSTPPHQYLSSTYRALQLYYAWVTAPSPTFTPNVSGIVIHNLQRPGNPLVYNFNIQPSKHFGAGLPPNQPRSLLLDQTESEVGMFFSTNFSSGALLNFNPPVRPAPLLTYGEHAQLTFDLQPDNWSDGNWITAWIRLSHGTATITDLLDISAIWRKRPGNTPANP